MSREDAASCCREWREERCPGTGFRLWEHLYHTHGHAHGQKEAVMGAYGRADLEQSVNITVVHPWSKRGDEEQAQAIFHVCIPSRLSFSIL